MDIDIIINNLKDMLVQRGENIDEFEEHEDELPRDEFYKKIIELQSDKTTILFAINTPNKKILIEELDWVDPGAHYYDDLYWSLITYVHRTKFNIDFRKVAYSALIRSGQMDRDTASEAIKEKYVLEDSKVIDLCIKRLGITREEFDSYLKLPPKNFWDYPNSYSKLKLFKIPIWIMCQLGFMTKVVYEKYFGLKFK